VDAEYSNEQEAARAVLRDVCRKLLDSNVQFSVVGGWVPFLLSSTVDLKHPGTYDADILVAEASLADGTFRASVERLLGEGYLRPAKNEFQAFRVVNVQGERRVFHADFLNPGSPNPEDLTFVRLDEEDRLGSAYTPAMDAVFKYDAWRSCEDPALAGVRFASEFGFIVTKAHSTTSKKRLRDLFDIFLTLRTSKDPEALAKLWQQEAESGVVSVSEGRESLRKAMANDAAMKYANQLFREGGSALTSEDLKAALTPLL
jgi:hypothetical protein